MVKRTGIVLLFIVFAVCVSISVFAADVRVFDDAGLFTDSEVYEIQSKIDEMRNDYGYDFVVVTADNVNSSSQAYADDYYDYNGFGNDGFLYLIDMDNRKITISTKGIMIDYVTNSRLDKLLDVGFEYVSEERYGDSAYEVLELLDEFIDDGIPGKKPNSLTGLEIIISIGAGALIGFAVYYGIKSNYELKGSTYSYNFREKSTANITSSKDTYKNTTVVRRPKPKSNNDDNNHSDTHTSSSGETHGGGSRSF